MDELTSEAFEAVRLSLASHQSAIANIAGVVESQASVIYGATIQLEALQTEIANLKETIAALTEDVQIVKAQRKLNPEEDNG